MKIIIISITCLLFCSCCKKELTKTDSSQNTTDKTEILRKQKGPTAIKINQTEVLLQTVEVLMKEKDDYTINATVLDTEENNNYLSIATVGATYNLKPAFILNEEGEISNDDRNKNLILLKDLQKGQIFNAIISLGNDKKWYIKQVISIEGIDK